MQIKVTSIEHARALPHAPLDYVDELLPSGVTVRHRAPSQFFPMPTDGKQLLWFIDSDGTPMEIVYTATGPTKREIRL